MAKTGLEIQVGEYEQGPLARRWHGEFRPIPDGARLAPEGEWRARLRTGGYDAVVAHNETNAADILADAVAGEVPRLLVCHNRRNFLERNMSTAWREAYAALLERLAQAFTFVFISQTKQASYGIAGEVIYPGVDPGDYAAYTGERAEVLRVGNAMAARDCMFDVDLQERVCAGLPHRLVGYNPELAYSRPSRSWEELWEFYQTRRCLLHVTREEYEDGYNLAMIEALATGMPVVALANRTSPLTTGMDGLVGADAAELRAHCERLLGDRAYARKMGAAGRETVAEKFPITRFAERWREVIEKAMDAGTYCSGHQAFRGNGSAAPTALIEYMSSPFTTGRYVAAAARRARHDVVTMGPRCPEALLRQWGFEGEIPAYRAQEIEAATYADAWRLFEQMRAGQIGASDARDSDAIFVYVDYGSMRLARGLDAMPCPKAAWFIDTHIDATGRIAMAPNFDCVFLAQRGQVALFRDASIDAEWLPLACDSELHDLPAQERSYDVAYVGSLNDADQRRVRLLAGVQERFPNCFLGKAWPEDMARIYAQSKIVVNASVNRDVNMRVFEGLASGALVITDEADGLEELFEDGRDLVVYRDDAALPELIARYLADDAARERIARAGRERVLAAHTYDDRWEEIVRSVARGLKHPPPFGHPPQGGTCAGDASRFAAGGYYRSARPELMGYIPGHARRVLDVGCGGGELGRALKARGALEVVGIEVVAQAAELARRHLDDVLCMNLETTELPFSDGHFDCVVCGDVLEHLVDPAAALRKLARVVRAGGTFVISIPNVRFYQVVHMLAEGRWRYEDAGIMDRTHLRFFTRAELMELVAAAGLAVLHLAPLSMIPAEYLPLGDDRSITMGRVTISDVNDSEYEEFRTFQYLVVAENQVVRGEAPKDATDGAAGAVDLEGEFEQLRARLAADFDDWGALTAATELARKLDRLDDVRRFLERYAEFYPAKVEAVHLFTDVLKELGEHAAAEARLRLLSAIYPDAAARGRELV
ncbi:MAG: glycosyltransferase [Candidatus Hydrogenedentales bacterium]